MTAVAGVLHYAGASPTAVFILAGVALGGLAWLIGVATESVGARFGPAVTGVLQSTLGNLPELFIVLFALSAGEIVVAQTSILGSLFANALLVLGLAIVAGAPRPTARSMRFRKRLPNDTATLLLLALSAIALLGLSDRLGDRASQHQVAISVVGAVCLLAVYGAWLWSYLALGRAASSRRSRSRPTAPCRSRRRSCVLGARRCGGGVRLGLVRRRARPGGRGARTSRRRSPGS